MDDDRNALRLHLNSIFDDCNPDANDTVESSVILGSLINSYSGDQIELTRLKSEFVRILGGDFSSKISRSVFLMSMMSEIPLQPPVLCSSNNVVHTPRRETPETYEYDSLHPGVPQHETFNLNNNDKSIPKIRTPLNDSLEQQLFAEQEANNQLTIQLKKQQKMIADNREVISCLISKTQQEQSLTSALKHEITELKNNIKKLKSCNKSLTEQYEILEKRNDSLVDDFEKEANKLKRELDDLQKYYKIVLEGRDELQEKNNKLENENQSLHNRLEHFSSLHDRFEEMVMEKKSLENQLACINEEEPPLTPHLSHHRNGISLNEELSMCQSEPISIWPDPNFSQSKPKRDSTTQTPGGSCNLSSSGLIRSSQGVQTDDILKVETGTFNETIKTSKSHQMRPVRLNWDHLQIIPSSSDCDSSSDVDMDLCESLTNISQEGLSICDQSIQVSISPESRNVSVQTSTLVKHVHCQCSEPLKNSSFYLNGRPKLGQINIIIAIFVGILFICVTYDDITDLTDYVVKLISNILRNSTTVRHRLPPH